ncbi:hypothetical protein DFS34DRAFT_651980 [Phlyctochytrium arcticum]|nr:hypothetical protein DFS34DRAFT_651980 [Phlyctochytrium arcticum]
MSTKTESIAAATSGSSIPPSSPPFSPNPNQPSTSALSSPTSLSLPALASPTVPPLSNHHFSDVFSISNRPSPPSRSRSNHSRDSSLSASSPALGCMRNPHLPTSNARSVSSLSTSSNHTSTNALQSRGHSHPAGQGSTPSNGSGSVEGGTSTSKSWEQFLQQYALGNFANDRTPAKPRKPAPFSEKYMPAPIPPPEVEGPRRRALYKYRKMLYNHNPEFADILHVTQHIFGVEHAFISFIWGESALTRNETCDFSFMNRNSSLCAHSVLFENAGGMVVLDMAKDWRFEKNPNVTDAPFIRFYASSHLKSPSGYTIGALCVTDSRPRTEFSEESVKELERCANLLMRELEMKTLQFEIQERDRREDALAEFSQAALVGQLPSLPDSYSLACSLIAQSLELEYVCIIEPIENSEHNDEWSQQSFHAVPERSGVNGSKRVILGSNLPELLNATVDLTCPGTYDLITATSDSTSGTEFSYPSSGPSSSCPNFLQGLDIRAGLAVPIHRGASFADDTAVLAAFTTDERRLFDASQMHFLSTFAVNISAVLLKIKAEAANTTKMALMGSVSHELRTPLHGLLGVSELLSATPLSSSQEVFVSTIESCGKSLLGIVNNVLDVAKRSGARKALSVKDIDLFGLLQEVMDAMTATVDPEVELLLNVQVPPDIRHVRSDPNAIRQTLINLVGNSLKFTERGFVQVKVSTLNTPHPHRDLSAEESTLATTANLRFEVIDTGSGISPAFLPHLFKPFSQENPMKQGAGLGLLLTRYMVESLGGLLTVESTLHSGTRFYFDVRMEVLSLGWDRTAAIHMAREASVESVGGSAGTTGDGHDDGVAEDWALLRLEGIPVTVQLGNQKLADTLMGTLERWELPVSSTPFDPTAPPSSPQDHHIVIVDWTSPLLAQCLAPPSIPSSSSQPSSSRNKPPAIHILLISSLAQHAQSSEYLRHHLRNPNATVAVLTKPVGPLKLTTALAAMVRSRLSSTLPPARLGNRLSVIRFEDILEDDHQPVIAEGATKEIEPEPDTHVSVTMKPTPEVPSQALTPPTTDPATPTSPPSQPTTNNTTHPPLLCLVAEDNAINRMILSQFLHKLGIHFIMAEDGQQAVDAYITSTSSSNQPYDFILMDIMMPVLTGNEAIRKIRQLEANTRPRSIIMALTSLSSKEDKRTAFEAGADSFLTKPIGMKGLRGVVEKYFPGRITS